jgi:hypothetical protein
MQEAEGPSSLLTNKSNTILIHSHHRNPQLNGASSDLSPSDIAEHTIFPCTPLTCNTDIQTMLHGQDNLELHTKLLDYKIETISILKRAEHVYVLVELVSLEGIKRSMTLRLPAVPQSALPARD